MFLASLLYFCRDFNVDAFWIFLASCVFFVAVLSVVDGSPSTWVCYFVVWDVETEVFGGEFMGFPATGLIVILDNKPETILKIEFNRKERALVVYVVPCLVPYGFVCGSFKEFLGDVVVASLFEC